MNPKTIRAGAAADETKGRDPNALRIAAACRAIEAADEPPGLSALAQAAGLSRFHFHRVFTKATGLTPKAYAAAARATRLRQALGRRRTITEAIYDAGFNSSSRFYEASERILGMAPKRFRDGGAGESIRFATGDCSLGTILAAASDTGLCAIYLGDEPAALRRQLRDQFPRAELRDGDRKLARQLAAVVRMVENPRAGLDLPLDVRGTVFQRRVWQALREIPAGATASYAEVARRVGAPKAVRAVASACAANKLAVVIPCHRVVRSDGGLSGYRWGVPRKRALLLKEKSNAL